MSRRIQEVHQAAHTLFQAFVYLEPRMQGGTLVSPQPMNAEALAGCILHGCLARLVGELMEQRRQMSIT